VNIINKALSFTQYDAEVQHLQRGDIIIIGFNVRQVDGNVIKTNLREIGSEGWSRIIIRNLNTNFADLIFRFIRIIIDIRKTHILVHELFSKIFCIHMHVSTTYEI
jgi:hypothetical protein